MERGMGKGERGRRMDKADEGKGMGGIWEGERGKRDSR